MIDITGQYENGIDMLPVLSMAPILVMMCKWLMNFWSKLPAPVKDRLIDLAMEGFDSFLRRYFQQKKRA